MESVFSMAAITFWALCAAGIAWYASEVAKDVTYVTLADGRTAFVEVIVEPRANVYPMIPGGRSVNDTIFD